jgi:hypothetical protein
MSWTPAGKLVDYEPNLDLYCRFDYWTNCSGNPALQTQVGGNGASSAPTALGSSSIATPALPSLWVNATDQLSPARACPELVEGDG